MYGIIFNPFNPGYRFESIFVTPLPPSDLYSPMRERVSEFFSLVERGKSEDHCHCQAILPPLYDLKNTMMGLFDNELGQNRFYWCRIKF
ncbi:hypothetical protein CMV_018608 [Castanea mollissima]|uniref:Uncharacterized protein n=1 Tax=Castanea mollissima TaxID=60419 RepID=A0A8J4VNJ9_9ROSI|nr:hypothetical protein CMV_018608 [Castanea mollissima]